MDTQISKYLHRLLITLYTNVDPGHRHCTPCPLVFVVKEDPQLNMNLNSNLNTTIDTNLNSNNTNTNSMVDAMALKVQFLAAFMEDRSESAPSYPLFLTQIRDKLNTK